MIGNDDAGQMSAWYVFATMGFYPVEPASGQYVLAAPLASRVSIRVPGRKPLVIESNGATGTQPCVSSVSFDGTAVDGPRIDHLRLAAGGTLRFNAN
jgi:putative alpha-1,2-mannosidase